MIRTALLTSQRCPDLIVGYITKIHVLFILDGDTTPKTGGPGESSDGGLEWHDSYKVDPVGIAIPSIGLVAWHISRHDT